MNPIDSAKRIIKSGNGFDIVVDADDYEWLSKWNWTAKKLGLL